MLFKANKMSFSSSLTKFCSPASILVHTSPAFNINPASLTSGNYYFMKSQQAPFSTCSSALLVSDKIRKPPSTFPKKKSLKIVSKPVVGLKQPKSKSKQSHPARSSNNNNVSAPIVQKQDREKFTFGLPQLSKGDCVRRVEFALNMLNLLEKDPNTIHNLIFSDEGNFWTFSSKNRFSELVSGPNNARKKFGGYKNKVYHESKPLPCIVWAGMTTKEVIGPYFFNSHVTANSYLAMLRKYFLPQLVSRNYNLSTTWFQQDSSPPHRSTKVLSFLKESFGSRLISYKTLSIAWPPRSQDLTPLDYFLWDYLKLQMKIYAPKNHENLRECLAFEMESIDPELLENVVHREFVKRLEKCVQANGTRFEMDNCSPKITGV